MDTLRKHVILQHKCSFDWQAESICLLVVQITQQIFRGFSPLCTDAIIFFVLSEALAISWAIFMGYLQCWVDTAS